MARKRKSEDQLVPRRYPRYRKAHIGRLTSVGWHNQFSGGSRAGWSAPPVYPHTTGFLPAQTDTKFVWAYTGSCDVAASGAPATIDVNLASLHAPVSTTHQPRGWDQMKALYQRYTVYGVGVEVVPLNVADATPGVRWCCLLFPDGNPTYDGTNTHITQLDEHPNRISKMFTSGNHNTGIAIGTSPRFKKYIRLADVYGITDIYDDSLAESDSGGNPSRSPILSIAAHHLTDATANPASQFFNVTVTYYARLKSLKHVAQS